MAEVEVAQFGAELKDGFKPVNSWVAHGISYLSDIEQFYRERSTIEAEYASKLQALARKHFEKKAKRSAQLSVGDTPAVTPGSLESASMSTWTTQLTTLEQRAAEHAKFSQQLMASLVDPLKHLQTRYEELRKLHHSYAERLEKERDSSYADTRKIKGRYDSACQEVEKTRKKSDSKHAQHVSEMHNVKNTYIISINVTNRQKERYYQVYVPELLNSLQDLNETRVGSLNNMWLRAASLEKQLLKTSEELTDHMTGEIPRNRPELDSLMFARHNTVGGAWQEPGDVVFEPSPVWLDSDTLAADDQAKNFLRNVLTKSKGQLGQLKRDAETKSREVEGARRVRAAIRAGQDQRDEVELVRQLFDLQMSLHDTERQKVSAEVEISTITTAVGDVSIGARNHNFKGETFKIPTNCDLCGDRIWGINAKGFTCKDCGFTCHSKCEMKAPADCLGELSKEEKKKMKLERQDAVRHHSPSNGANGSTPDLGGSATIASLSSATTTLQRSDTMNTLSSGYSASANRSVSGTPSISTATEEELPASAPPPKKAPAPVGGTRRNRIVAPPPTKYVASLPTSDLDPVEAKGASESRQRGKMMYPYTAGGEGELSVADGQEISIEEPDDGSGWLRVSSSGQSGLVPASYVDILPLPRPTSTYSNSSSNTAGSVSLALKKKGPAVAPRRGAKRIKFVEVLYEYEARSEGEHSIREGERVVLVSADKGDGWCEVEREGRVGSVPAAYVREV